MSSFLAAVLAISVRLCRTDVRQAQAVRHARNSRVFSVDQLWFHRVLFRARAFGLGSNDDLDVLRRLMNFFIVW